MWQIANEVGLNKILCNCGSTINGTVVLEKFFLKIASSCDENSKVRIKNFGTFHVKRLKRKKIKTPFTVNGEISLNEPLVFRFRPSAKIRNLINNRKESSKKG